jgi:hypothetical protein
MLSKQRLLLWITLLSSVLVVMALILTYTFQGTTQTSFMQSIEGNRVVTNPNVICGSFGPNISSSDNPTCNGSYVVSDYYLIYISLAVLLIFIIVDVKYIPEIKTHRSKKETVLFVLLFVQVILVALVFLSTHEENSNFYTANFYNAVSLGWTFPTLITSLLVFVFYDRKSLKNNTNLNKKVLILMGFVIILTLATVIANVLTHQNSLT